MRSTNPETEGPDNTASLRHPGVTTPHAMRTPEFPEGSVR